jgi:hypothetical protein
MDDVPLHFFGLACAKITTVVVGQTTGARRSFQRPMTVQMALMRSGHRRTCRGGWLVGDDPNKVLTKFSRQPLGVKCSLIIDCALARS